MHHHCLAAAAILMWYPHTVEREERASKKVPFITVLVPTHRALMN